MSGFICISVNHKLKGAYEWRHWGPTDFWMLNSLLWERRCIATYIHVGLLPTHYLHITYILGLPTHIPTYCYLHTTWHTTYILPMHCLHITYILRLPTHTYAYTLPTYYLCTTYTLYLHTRPTYSYLRITYILSTHCLHITYILPTHYLYTCFVIRFHSLYCNTVDIFLTITQPGQVRL